MASEVFIDAAAPARSRALDRRLIHGVTWTGAVKGVTLLLSWLSTIAVARILSPADYGLVAMATVYIGLTTMVTDFGLGSAIVALRDLDDNLKAQLHTVAACIGAAAVIATCIVAVPLGHFFKSPGVVPVVIVLSTALLLDSLRTVPIALLARDLRFKELSLLEGAKAMIAVVITLAIALTGGAHWSLVLGNVIASLVLTLFILVKMPQRAARPRWSEIRSTVKFSANFLTGQIAWYAYSNADFVVAGRILGPSPLGQYTLAWTLTSAPADKIMAVFGRVMPTMLSAAQRDLEALRRYFLLFTEALAMLIVPTCLGLALVAPDFVPLVFGAKWSAVVIPLQLLCAYTAIHILGTPTTPVLQVSGQASFPAKCGVLTVLILPPAFYVAGLRWSTQGIATVWLTVYPLVLIPVFVRVFKTLRIGLREYAACIAPTLASAAFMTAIVIGARMLTADAPLITRFIFEVVTGAAAFIGAVVSLQKRRLGEVAALIRDLRS
jgi:O-antigen/teichoic acid export membrane protein